MAISRVKNIVFQKLHNRAWGEADDDTIYIDPRAKGKKLMETAHHEMLHVIFPDMDEKTVMLAAKELTRNMWKLHYRRIDNDTSQPLQTLKQC